MEPLLVGLDNAGDRLGVSRSTIERLIAAQELEKVRIGRRALVTVASIEAFYQRHLEETEQREWYQTVLRGRLRPNVAETGS